MRQGIFVSRSYFTFLAKSVRCGGIAHPKKTKHMIETLRFTQTIAAQLRNLATSLHPENETSLLNDWRVTHEDKSVFEIPLTKLFPGISPESKSMNAIIEEYNSLIQMKLCDDKRESQYVTVVRMMETFRRNFGTNEHTEIVGQTAQSYRTIVSYLILDFKKN